MKKRKRLYNRKRGTLISPAIRLPDYATYSDINKLPVGNNIILKVGVVSDGVKKAITERFPDALIIHVMPYHKVTAFLGKWNRGEFPSWMKLGRAFVDEFGHDFCKGHSEVFPCLTFQQDNKLTIKAIWEMVEEESV